MVRRSGPNVHGSPAATLESKRTVMVRADTCSGAAFATWVVPPNPVVRQNQEYSGTAAYDTPIITAPKPPKAKATTASRVERRIIAAAPARPAPSLASRCRTAPPARRAIWQWRSSGRGGHAVQRPGIAEQPRCNADRRQHQRVAQNLAPRFGRAGHNRKHRHASAGVIVRAIKRQRPEMRRRPQEDDQEQDQRLDREAAGGCRPADHRRQRASGAADDDVLWRYAFEPDRVDADIKADGEGEQRRR